MDAAVRAAYAMRGAASVEALASFRESAVAAADALTATAARVLSRP
ncbi:hypothetical protein [Streptomyces atratus]|nr:hypothetical protein [Streptomyces atratus]MCX5340503.1 hypothetical protein [Streptomyces atratus]